MLCWFWCLVEDDKVLHTLDVRRRRSQSQKGNYEDEEHCCNHYSKAIFHNAVQCAFNWYCYSKKARFHVHYLAHFCPLHLLSLDTCMIVLYQGQKKIHIPTNRDSATSSQPNFTVIFYFCIELFKSHVSNQNSI